MPYKQEVLVKLEGAELRRMRDAWEKYRGSQMLVEHAARLLAQAGMEWNEAWDLLADHLNLDRKAIHPAIYDPTTNEAYRRIWVDKLEEGDLEERG